MTVGGTSSEVVMLGNQIHSSIVLKKESETLCTISIDMSSLNYLVRKYFKQVYAWTQFFLGICFGSLSSVFQNVCSLYSSSFLEKHFSQF